MNEKTRAIWDIRLSKLIEATKLYQLTKKGEGSLHPFVTGLIFSSMLIEEIKQDLTPQLSVIWGQAINEVGILSKEIDIIVFHGKPYHVWKNIGYAIVPSSQIRAVFEVKGWLGTKKYTGYKNDFEDLKPFSPVIYLAVQYHICKKEESLDKVRNQLMAYNFDDVFFFTRYPTLEDFGKPRKAIPIQKDWYRFIETVRQFRD